MRKFNVNVNGNKYSVEVEELDDSLAAEQSASAPAKEVSAVKEVSAPVAPKAPLSPVSPVPPAPAEKSASGGSAIKAPMPGLVLSLSLSEGAAVKKGDKLLVLEAMKMENDIVSPYDGVVKYAVKKGDNVNSGDDLAFIG